MPSPDDSDESDELDAKAEKYRNHELDRQFAEYQEKLHAKPRLWNRPSFYMAIGVALALIAWFIVGR
jgi:hypothetical protein